MEKIKIITDSTLDLPSDLIKEKNIEVLPLLINFGEESYLDGVEINTREMLDRIERENILPTTAQITPNRFEEVFKKYLDEGYKIVTLLLSSEMSGTYQSACIAKNMLDTDDIVVIDSRNVTSGLGVLALKACEFRDNGDNIFEIEEKIKGIIPKVKSSLSFESLENLVRGGRLSKTAGTIGSVLGLRLILEVKDGQMAVKDKVRGSKKALKKVISDFENGNVDINSPIVLLEILNEEIYSGLKKYFEENNINYIDAKVGCTVGIHSGTRACGIFFIEK
ncbi:DegV family protein [uncultured Clostridium sp.]|uniref:DegV family protein n=1 Tax=uncultured Clostridium sp. TaxID=59620 RepID=UPI0025EF0AEE|nr:DegV family protein [uncultured Clostridium sp.]MDU4884444.1 DegV family protein [Clostridium celatum]MDU7077569.1 DegV family protein [Clostridium celatum]